MSTPRLTHNAHVDRASVSKAGIADPAFHPSLPDFATTPLRPAPKSAQRLGVRSVLVKDESQRLGMPSFKILGASWAAYRTIMAHLGLAVGAQPTLASLREAVAAQGSDLTLVAATDGNHGRAVARMAKLLGLPGIIMVPGGTVDSRIEAIRGEGADVRVVKGGYDEAIAASAALSDDRHVVISDTSWEGYTDTPGWVIDGYSTMLKEITDEIGAGRVAEPTVVVAQMGVGAFAAAVTREFATRPARMLVGVEPVSADCIITSAEAGRILTIPGTQDSIMAGLNCGTPSIIAWDDVFHGYDVFVTVTDDDARDAMRLLHDDGIAAGESGAAGLAGLLAHAQGLGLGSQDDLIILVTEGITDPVAYREIIGTDG
ncbi:MAG: diaminopropionate ammonia-lyase [Dermatophilaceae bacterium]|nr:diaminopropionate ammonia-lyase [Dermatophilaceae bacterium]